MKHYKDENNKVFAFENDGSQDDLIPENLIAISNEEADLIRNPPKTPLEVLEETKLNRACAYRDEADPLFFKFQRGEIDKQVWLDKVAEIKARFA